MSLTLDEYISDDSGSVQENGEVTEEQVEWQHIGQILPDKFICIEPQEEIASEQIVLSNGVANSETVTSCYTTSKFKKRSLSDTPGSEKKRRGRPPKPESEKKQKPPPKPRGRPPNKGHIQVAITHKRLLSGLSSPQNSTPHINLPTLSSDGQAHDSSDSPNNNLIFELILQNVNTNSKFETNTSQHQSPFPLISFAESVKKNRGRPRTNPPKDPSLKRPRGRPRTVPLDSEKAWRAECGKLRRMLKKKDDLINRLKQALTELGHSVADIMKESKQAMDEEDEFEGQEGDEDEGGDQQDEQRENGESDSSLLMESSVEDSHQKYLGLFAGVEEDEGEDANDDEDEDSLSDDEDS